MYTNAKLKYISTSIDADNLAAVKLVKNEGDLIVYAYGPCEEGIKRDMHLHERVVERIMVKLRTIFSHGRFTLQIPHLFACHGNTDHWTMVYEKMCAHLQEVEIDIVHEEGLSAAFAN
jgi:hypothetical protein